MEQDLPTLPLTLHAEPDGRITTGHPVEDQRLANAIRASQEHAKRSGQMMYIYEHPKYGLAISWEIPAGLNYVEVFPGGRTVFKPGENGPEMPPETT